jgi:uncharacterized protein
MVPLQVIWTRMGEHRAHGTSLAAIVPISLAAALLYYFGGERPEVDLRVAGVMTIGSVVGAYVGARLMTAIPERQLATGIALLLGLVGLKEVLLP